MLEAHSLEAIRGERRLFSGLDFCARAGELLHITGPNGSGKTTLMRILCGLTLPTSGEVCWNHAPISRCRDEYHGSLLYIGHASGIKADLTAEENLRIACALRSRDPGRDAVRDALGALGLSAQAELPARVLSQGQRRRVSLARLLLEKACALWILDEPFAALDTGATETLRRLIESHQSAGGITMFTTHQEIPLAPHALRTLDLSGNLPGDRPGTGAS